MFGDYYKNFGIADLLQQFQQFQEQARQGGQFPTAVDAQGGVFGPNSGPSPHPHEAGVGGAPTGPAGASVGGPPALGAPVANPAPTGSAVAPGLPGTSALRPGGGSPMGVGQQGIERQAGVIGMPGVQDQMIDLPGVQPHTGRPGANENKRDPSKPLPPLYPITPPSGSWYETMGDQPRSFEDLLV